MAPIKQTLETNNRIQQIFMSHNQMSDKAITMLSEGLKGNIVLTDLFFTHNDLASEGGDGGVLFIQALANKKELKSLALNSCNLNG